MLYALPETIVSEAFEVLSPVVRPLPLPTALPNVFAFAIKYYRIG